MNAKCLNDMYSVKQLNYSMRQSVKLVQPQRKTTTVGLKTVSYFGAKLWNDNAVLCNELRNEEVRIRLAISMVANYAKFYIINSQEFHYGTTWLGHLKWSIWLIDGL